MSRTVHVDTAESDTGGFVERVKEAARRVTLKPGYSMEWSGQYENMLGVRERLKLVVPITLFTISVLYPNTGSGAWRAS